MTNLTCPFCGSTNTTNKGNGQEYPAENQDQELYVALEPDWYDGPVNKIECDNGHRFYVPFKSPFDDIPFETI